MFPLINGQDAIIQFQSGTGKTLTFLIGLLWGFDPQNACLQYIFLTSTHQVATQIFELIQKLLPAANLSLCIGGTKKQSGGFKTSNQQTTLQEKRLELKRAQIIVGTVGKTYEFLCIKKSFRPLSMLGQFVWMSLISWFLHRKRKIHRMKSRPKIKSDVFCLVFRNMHSDMFLRNSNIRIIL